jgi:hypothetical protein
MVAAAGALAIGLAVSMLPVLVSILLVIAIGIGAFVALRATAWSSAAGAALYILALEWIYASFISPVYAYMGLVYSVPEFYEFALVMVLAWLPALAMPRSVQMISEVVVWVLYLLVYVPAILMTFHIFGIQLELFVVLPLAMGILLAAQRLPRRPVEFGFLTPGQHRFAVAALAAGGIAAVTAVFGFSLELPGLSAVYDTRQDYRMSIREAPSVVGYLVPWLGRAIFPLALMLGLRDRRLTLVGLAILGELLIFATAGFRSALFVMLLVVAGYVIATWRQHARILPWTASAIVGVAGGAALVGNLEIASLSVRRTALVPGQLTGYYYDFFSHNPTYGLRHSVLSFLGDPPYGDVLAPFLIGDIYFRNADQSANANVWADAMANFGIVGVIAFTVLLSFGLWAADRLTGHHGPTLTVAAGAIIGFSLSNSGLFTSTMSAGVGALIALVAIGRPRVPP